MRLCDLNDIKMRVERQYENCHGYSGNKKAIYREAILAVRSILHSAKTIDVVRCRECKLHTSSAFYPDRLFCQEHGRYVDPDGYCYLGARKEGADNR